MPSDDLKEVLDRRYPSYHEPLQIAWAWNRSAEPEKHDQARTLLDELVKRYPHVLPVWYEQVYSVLKDRAKRDQALRLLAEIGERFRGMMDEDMLSLWGRCHKARGDELRLQGTPFPPGRPQRESAFAEADRAYREACMRYEQAYLLNRNGFPGVNLATLLLLRAALAADLKRPAERDDLLASSRRLAEELVQASADWKEKLNDDNIWIPATRGEAALLLGRWDAAAAHYRTAAGQPNRQPAHPKTMKDQIRRIVDAYALLGVQVEGDLADPEAFFGPAGGCEES